MIHLIVSGHGEFAYGLLTGAKLLYGEPESCDVVNFTEGMSSEVLREKLQACVDNAGDAEILFLTDILGGTPFRESSAIAATLKNAEVLSGANLQILTEALVEREGSSADVKTFARELIASAQECMVLLSDKLVTQQQLQQNSADDDGI